MRWLLVLMVALVVTPAANATFSIAITGTKVTAPGITLNGVDQTSTFTVAATETNTGGGNTAGWNVTAASATLTSAGKTLPALEVTTVARGNCTGTGCVNPTNSITWPITLSTTAQKIYNATAGTGKGTVILTGTYQVTYPANALPGTYTAVVTLATATGP
jgi:hypothetical protein